jgi:hypothetical protein
MQKGTVGIIGKGEKEGKERTLRSEENQSMIYIYIYIYGQKNQTHQTQFEKGKKKVGRYGNTMEGVNLIEEHCMHPRNYHNETHLYY